MFFELKLSNSVIDYFKSSFLDDENFKQLNDKIFDTCGIENFFSSQSQATYLRANLLDLEKTGSKVNRREYGDFQTNDRLANEIVEYIHSKNPNLEFILEPTCGEGSFIIAALKTFKKLKKIVGIEIYLPYVWETKFRILDYFLNANVESKPKIEIISQNVFDFNFEKLANKTLNYKTLILGNPPWVTNSELESISSSNLPKKSNFKNHTGFDAVTGKANFDIGEYISLEMLKYFDHHNGVFSFLLKNNVVKNIIHDQKSNRFKISNAEKLAIDTKKEFNASVNSCLFYVQLNKSPELTCDEFNFYNSKYLSTFGWYNEKFVSSIHDYKKSFIIDGKSLFKWRSGVKHDCSKIMELDKVDNLYINKLGEEVNLEDDLVYGILKSSDLKSLKLKKPRKFTIITQKKIGQETKYIKIKYPLTFKYLNGNIDFFKKRKSMIYKSKPNFSIFGIGDYSFMKYKVGISGFYRSTHFTLIKTHKNKPLMLDDTCYFIGFNELKMAEIANFLVNSELVQKFLSSIIFSDSKRSINKDVLMRIDFKKVFNHSNFEEAKKNIKGLTRSQWDKFNSQLDNEVLK